MCTITMSEIGSIRKPGILWFRSCNNGNSVRYFMRRGMRVAHILARKLHGWLGFRTEQGEPFPAVEGCVVLCCVVRSFDIPVYTRETRYAAWILTRRNCTHNCDATRSIIALESIIKRWTLARISYAIISGD